MLFYFNFPNTSFNGLLITSVAIKSYGVLSLFIITKFLPLKYSSKLLAGITVSDVPQTINKSHFDIYYIDFIKLSGRFSPYSTTSGLIRPPQLHRGIPVLLNI